MAKKKKTAGTRAGRSRRGKGESNTGAKANAVEVRTAGIGDNSGLALVEPSDWNHHFKSIKGLKEKAATAQSLVRHAKTAANKLRTGLSAVIEDVISIERENDPVKLKSYLELMGVGLSCIGSTIQLNVFDSLAGDQMELVYKRGFADGEAGRTADNKYPETSDLHAEYNRGWRHGTGKNMNLTPEQVDSANEQQEAA